MEDEAAPGFGETEAQITWRLLSWGGEAQWFAKQGDRVLGGRLWSRQALEGTIRNANALGWNLYLNANPSRHRSGAVKLDRSDIRFWRYIVVDIDPVDALAPPNFAYHNLTRGNIVFTGRGYQVWLCVEPLDNFDQAERIMRNYLKQLNNTTEHWAPGWLVDTSCSDLARVVRVPGSTNQKSGAEAHIEHLSNGLMSQAEYMGYDTCPPETVAIKQPTNFASVLSALSMTAKLFLLQGVGEGGRHRAAFHTAKSLHELGVPHELAKSWLAHGARMCRGSDNDVLIQDSIRALRKLYGGNRNGLASEVPGITDGPRADGSPGSGATDGIKGDDGQA